MCLATRSSSLSLPVLLVNILSPHLFLISLSQQTFSFQTKTGHYAQGEASCGETNCGSHFGVLHCSVLLMSSLINSNKQQQQI